ncbi:MAG: histidine kinase [Deltaproteobacteria bacterium]|nr:histidine kinase [Deltaproteobacteria bacterium]
MLKQISLRIRIYAILTVLVLITFSGGLVMVWYTYRMEGLFSYIIDKNVAAFQAAEALEIALVNQKGFVSYYFLDGDPEWLRQLGKYRQIFKERLNESRSLVENEQQKKAIHLIESEYIQYIISKDKVIELYKAGDRETGSKLHKDVREHFFRTLELCGQFKDLHTQKIKDVRDASRDQARKLRIIACTAMLLAILLGIMLAFVLINHILGPIRKMAMEADRKSESDKAGDEVKALGRSVHGLIEDIDQTHSELQKSRETLLQAEKMALVGKLAAGMAHSIRNPLTSVKMRVFSLNRTLYLSASQKEDFEVISEEIRHIDNTVQNFLEFSRPPKLKMQKISPSEVVDLTLQLLRHRLESYDVEIKLNRTHPLPEVQADPEQLKEVLVNIIVNSCEAMEGSGFIEIHEEETVAEPMGRVAVIRLEDNGPGIPESLMDKVFQPFFSTKEEGTGLGLSIASRIVEEHGGSLDLISREGDGTTFVITMPVKESDIEHNPDH